MAKKSGQKIIDHERDLVVSFVNIQKCHYCDNPVFAKLSQEEKETIFLCSGHYQKIVVEGNKKVRYTQSVENSIELQNGIKGVAEIPLFSSKSLISPKIPPKWFRMNEIRKKKEMRKRKQRIPTQAYFAWEFGEKTSFSLWGDQNILLVEFKDNYFVFHQTGEYIGELDGSGNILSEYE